MLAKWISPHDSKVGERVFNKLDKFATQSVRGGYSFVEHVEGAAPVAKPPREGQCWVLVHDRWNSKKWRRCELRVNGHPDEKRCTCFNHKKWEQEARFLRDSGAETIHV